MGTPMHRDNLQSGLYQVALSLDALLVNGIQYGVITALPANSVIDRLGQTLLRDLGAARNEIPRLPTNEQRGAEGAFEAAVQEFHTLIAILNRLTVFHEMTLPELRTLVAKVVETRRESIRLIEEMERCFHVREPFYRHRSAQSADAVDNFMANLEAVMLAKWNAPRTVASPV